MGKRGQLKLSFGMIFSIILIIIFITFAIYGIGKFLKLQQNLQTKKFADDFQDDIDHAWKSISGSMPVSYFLPKNIISICFDSGSTKNLKLWKKNGKFGGGFEIEHIQFESDFCIESINGNIKMQLNKNREDALVTISKK